jgi:hypothetical protein
MQSRLVFVRLLTRCAAATVLLTAAVQVRVLAQAQRSQGQAPPRLTLATATYNLLIASGFLCESADGCPAVAQAEDGETIEISGAGRLNLADKSVNAAGAFIQKSPGGTIVNTGVWTATGLASFQSYGIAPFALLRDYPQLRPAGMLAMTGPMMKMPGPFGALMSGPLAAGGLAVIRIRLLPDAGMPQDALLRVNCAQGKVPEGQQSDSIKLAITGGRQFNVPVAGHAVFLLQRPTPTSFGRGKGQ